MARRKSRRNPKQARSARTGRYVRSNPSKPKKGAAKKAAKRTTAKRAATKRPAAAKKSTARKRGHRFQALTGPRVTKVGGVRALKVSGKQQRGMEMLQKLQTGDRVRILRKGKDIAHFSVGGVRPRGNPSARRRLVTIRTRDGVRRFMARR